MKGVPLRLELGPKDIANNQCVLVRRDNRQKYFVSLDELETEIPKILAELNEALYNAALERRQSMTYTVEDLDEMIAVAKDKPGFIRAMWCGELECELKLKEVAEVSSRCMPFGEEGFGETCVCCGKPAKHLVYWGKAY